MQRRRLLSLLAVSSAASALTGCGFALRNSANFPFKSVFIQAADTSPLARQLQRALEASGVTVLRAPSNPELAQQVFELLQEQHERMVISQSATGAVRELQLRLRVRYRLRPTQGDKPGEVVELVQTRDLTYDETYALAKEAEERLLFTDMQTDLVGQIVRRLAS
ncbi:hypothetical protein E8K88_07980 [Lampropedia aestuarii]|uniref:LPS-assembly lipoprotein LptE n=1 Tax=Lampropedia aestuarii TaxID=2562762 RepID=A0A4S5BNL1_9BURK|nr:LPS assembly lipoprotein LptE [Lampropedia aestuarii]MDH5858505.1 LPS assembly lipoprotein LptE [Lampropedia aestuarii]THJ34020.1 hypothetical protein E8K88_07980 [Lampropedia aestuarii]